MIAALTDDRTTPETAMTSLDTRFFHSRDGTQVSWNPPVDSQVGSAARSLLAGLAASLVLLVPGAWLVYSGHAEKQAATAARAERMKAHDRLIAEAPGTTLPLPAATHGRDLFVTTCAACHSADGSGVAGLGKALTTSWFVASLDDEALHKFVTEGRPVLHPDNTSRFAMPPRGGRDDLTDADVGDIVTYVRGLQDPRRLPALSAFVAAPVAPPTESEKAVALAAAGGDAELAEYIAHGTKVYAMTCSACHGKDGKGVQGQGKDLTTSDFVRKLNDDGLLEFIKRGRDPGDPLNTTKVAMPPKGGNPALSDDDMLDVIAYLRSLQAPGAAAP